MTVDVFGRVLNRESSVRGPPGIGFKLTETGDYDIENKLLCNIADPKEFNDAVNLRTLLDRLMATYTSINTVDSELKSMINYLKEHISKLEVKIIQIQEKVNKNSTIIKNINSEITEEIGPRISGIVIDKNYGSHQRSFS